MTLLLWSNNRDLHNGLLGKIVSAILKFELQRALLVENGYVSNEDIRDFTGPFVGRSKSHNDMTKAL